MHQLHHNTADLSEPVRLAIGFIDDHLAEDLTVTTIASAAYISPRGLQLAFRRSLDTTPQNFVRQLRLHRAHVALVAAQPAATSVSAVASQSGFRHGGRFASAYRAEFGESPGATLAKVADIGAGAGKPQAMDEVHPRLR